jgi:DNA-binding response OmpR family regulator
MRLLVVEDDLILSNMWADLFSDAGAQVLGPCATTFDALRYVQSGKLDAALLDIQVRDGVSFPVARALTRLGVPYAFLSGSDREDLPAEFVGYPFLHKPVSARDIFGALEAMVRHY